MMNEDSFFEALETQYSKQLPFVVYSRPINSIIKSWLQNDTTLHKTESFGESGFVFAPFDFKEQSILLPEADCKYSTLEIEHLDIEDNSKNVSIEASEKEAHINLVSKGIATINSGSLKKVVLSRCESKDLGNENPFSIFKKLFNTYKNAMVYCWYHPKVGLWLGATPELLLKVEGKQLTTISLAGTQPYNSTSNVNWTTKEFEEQQIVTDYIANQIQPYSKQVNISEVETARAGNLLHLKSKITGFIDATVNLKSIIEALHPTPAVCGFPKQEAKDFILQNENYVRGYYTGFLGELNLKQSRTRNTNRRNVENNAYAVVRKHSNFYVNLRCMQLKDSKALIYVGGGITKDSNPENEWEETVNKSRTIGSVLD
ncbi:MULTISPECIES: chorismate-binding protein [Winogradskyella]|uniref:chorismate-binding protein n=1 Tax=Winogradskyella TaxID=286104 RepID=UPI00293BB872|nr:MULTISPECIES: chorismate-binding protein [Winogradskyella]